MNLKIINIFVFIQVAALIVLLVLVLMKLMPKHLSHANHALSHDTRPIPVTEVTSPGPITGPETPIRIGWAHKQIDKEIDHVAHAAALKGKLAQPPVLPGFSPVMHTQSIPQVTVACTSTGAQQSLIWSNSLGTVAVVGGFAWLGVDMGAIEDAYVLAINLNNGDVWDVATNEDHYQDRSGGAASSNIPFGHPPFAWQLGPTDKMEILVGCRGLANYHIGASLIFQYLSPAPAPTPAATQGNAK